MVRIIDPKPDAALEKQAVCRTGCLARVAYVPNDVSSYRYSAMGEMDTAYVIKCPSCGKDIQV